MTLLIPVDKATSLGVRPIVSRDEALQAINSMSGKSEALPADWKLFRSASFTKTHWSF